MKKVVDEMTIEDLYDVADDSQETFYFWRSYLRWNFGNSIGGRLYGIGKSRIIWDFTNYITNVSVGDVDVYDRGNHRYQLWDYLVSYLNKHYKAIRYSLVAYSGIFEGSDELDVEPGYYLAEQKRRRGELPKPRRRKPPMRKVV